MENREDRVILIDKPAGMTSFGVVARVRGRLREELGHKIKVGHTGTLDPFATGLLILLAGKMTKKSNEFLKLDKEYEATLRLGQVSTTGDPEGEISDYPGETGAKTTETGAKQTEPGAKTTERAARLAAPHQKIPTLSEIHEVLQSFLGEICQTVPRFSAVKIDGQRAYKLARAGKDFETPRRTVQIYEIEVLNYDWPELKIRCKVSSGTYIRTLAEDIGAKLDVGAYLTTLRRTQVGKWRVEDAEKL